VSLRCVRTWASVLHRSGITVSSRCVASLFRRRSGIAVASQLLHAGNASLATASQWHRSGISVSPHWQCESRFSVAEASQCLHAVKSKPRSASQWHRSVFTLAMQASLGFDTASQWHRRVFTLSMKASLRLRSGIAASSRCYCRLRFSFAVASQRLHAGNTRFV